MISHRCSLCEKNNQLVNCHRYKMDESLARINHYRNRCKEEEEKCTDNPELDIVIWKYLTKLDDAVQETLKNLEWLT